VPTLASRTLESSLALPVRWLLAGLGITLFFASFIPRLELRTDGSALEPLGSEAVRLTDLHRDRFHEREQVLLLFSATANGPSVESPRGLRALKAVHEGLDALPGLGGARVSSLVNLVDVAADGDELAIGEFLETVPDDPEAFARLRERIRRHPFAVGLMLGEGGRAAALYIHLDDALGRRESLAEIRDWVDAESPEGFELRLTGPVVAEALLGERVMQDLAWQVPLMTLVVALLLFATLRTAAGVMLPLLEALLVLLWTFGAMAIVGVPITLVTTILPIILMAISITDEIHLLERVQDDLAERTASGARIGRSEVSAAVRAALRNVGRPIVLTSLTTALGFLSFTTASIVPLRAFGVFTAFGILLAMVLTFSLIPALLVSLPPSWLLRRRRAQRGGTRRFTAIETFVVSHGVLCLYAGVLLVALGLPGMARLEIQDAWVDNFDPNSPLVLAEQDFNRDFWGSYRLDVVAEGPRGHFSRAEGAALFEEVDRIAQSVPHVGGVYSYLVPLQRVAQSLDIHSPISTLSPREIADLNTLLDFAGESSDDLVLVGAEEALARTLIYVRSANYQRGSQLLAALQTELTVSAHTRGVSIDFSGDIPVAVDVVHAIVVNQLRSIALTLAGVALVLLLLSRRFAVVALAIAPVAASLAVLFGAMGYAGVPLGIATSMFASLTVGVGVDFALHVQHTYAQEREHGTAHAAALAATLAKAGRAIRWNVGVLAVGFSVLTLSELAPNRALGILLGAAMLVCYAMTLLLLPQLLRLSSPQVER